MDVQSRDLDGFSDDDLFVLNALANQVAVAVDSAWSYRAQQEEAWMTTVLLQVAHVASRANTLDDVLDAITRLAPMLTGVASLWHLAARRRERAASSWLPATGCAATEQEPDQLRLRPEADPVPALMLLLETLEHVELTTDDEFMLPHRFSGRALPGDRLILLPLLAQNRLIGCLLVSLDSEAMPIRLHEKRLSMLNGVANQAAAAIENVRLANAREEEAWISWALLEVSQAMANAHTVDDMLEQVVRLTPLLAGVDRCAALLREAQSGEFVVAHYYLGRRETPANLDGIRLRAGDLPLLDLAVSTQRLQRVDDASQSDLVPPAWREGVGSKTLVVAPLLVQGEVRGALLVDSAELSFSMSQRREDILSGIAQQLSLNLENFHLLAQEQDRIRLAEELQVAQRIQASLLPAVVPAVPGYEIAHAWDPAREVGGDFYDFLPLPHGKLGLLMADVADKGIPAALFMATTSTLLRCLGAQPCRAGPGAAARQRLDQRRQPRGHVRHRLVRHPRPGQPARRFRQRGPQPGAARAGRGWGDPYAAAGRHAAGGDRRPGAGAGRHHAGARRPPRALHRRRDRRAERGGGGFRPGSAGGAALWPPP